MTPAIYEEITTALKREPLPLTQVYALVKTAGSSWTEAQVQLFLTCMDGVEVEMAPAETPIVKLGKRTKEEELVEAIVEVVKSNTGKPILVAEIRKKLPGKYVTTEAQIKSLVKKTSVLELSAPGHVRYKG
ncbi:hypothetical protein NIES4071_06800 [Calothrix sp. NIES-4071]|nr:hypothetical protein NIES4071_06800 [Calothrix sp. NIES-4071]BAZ55022.1 hypothetical protein NIES4105_06760 [Calothrix sp. NIES-4105]